MKIAMMVSSFADVTGPTLKVFPFVVHMRRVKDVMYVSLVDPVKDISHQVTLFPDKPVAWIKTSIGRYRQVS